MRVRGTASKNTDPRTGDPTPKCSVTNRRPLAVTGGGGGGGAWYDAPPAVEIQNQGIQRRKGGAAEHSRINSGIPLCARVRSEGRTMPKLCTVVKVKS